MSMCSKKKVTKVDSKLGVSKITEKPIKPRKPEN